MSAAGAPVTTDRTLPVPPDEVLFGSTRAMQAVRERVQKIATSNLPVLIQGESGTGKDIIARMIHRLSAWSNEAGFNQEITLPSGIFIEAILPQIPDDLESVRRLVLMPGAPVPAIGVQFANHRGARRIVRLDPMTGFPHVESVDTK